MCAWSQFRDDDRRRVEVSERTTDRRERDWTTRESARLMHCAHVSRSLLVPVIHLLASTFASIFYLVFCFPFYLSRILVYFAFCLFSALLRIFFLHGAAIALRFILGYLCCGCGFWSEEWPIYFLGHRTLKWWKGCWLSFKLRRLEWIGSESSVATIFWLLPLGGLFRLVYGSWLGATGKPDRGFIVFYLGIWDRRGSHKKL